MNQLIGPTRARLAIACDGLAAACEGSTVSMKIQQNIGMYFDWGAGSALGVALLVFVGLIFLVAHRLAGLERMFKG